MMTYHAGARAEKHTAVPLTLEVLEQTRQCTGNAIDLGEKVL